MSDITLIIGNKNYSSWSLRPWILLQHLQLPFTEIVIALDQADTRARIAEHSPAGRVPILKHGALVVWDSLAIGEYLCELAAAGLPADRSQRARARAACAEMHSAFLALRNQWPMNARAHARRTAMTAALAEDLRRIDALWSECLARRAQGPWLFGDYSLADAMYAPVVLRFHTYGAQLSTPAQAYVDFVLQDPWLQQWIGAAAREPWTIQYSELGLGPVAGDSAQTDA